MNTLQQALFKQKPSRNSGGGVNTALGISGKYTAPRKYSTAGAGKIVPFPPDNAQNFPLQEIILGCSSRLLYFFPKTPFKEGCHHIHMYVHMSFIPVCVLYPFLRDSLHLYILKCRLHWMWVIPQNLATSGLHGRGRGGVGKSGGVGWGGRKEDTGDIRVVAKQGCELTWRKV